MSNIKILVLSDSHGYGALMKKAIQAEKPFDYLVHCGDIEGPRQVIDSEPDYELIAVRGNCDSSPDLEIEEIFKAGFYNIWVTHGNKYNVKYEMDLRSLLEAGKKRRADIVLFGHSHYAEVVRDPESGILMMNPGSIGMPRSSAEKATYGILTLTEDYDIIPEIKTIDN